MKRAFSSILSILIGNTTDNLVFLVSCHFHAGLLRPPDAAVNKRRKCSFLKEEQS
jgi:hypothetical protein